MGITVSVLASLFIAYNSRSPRESAFHRPLSNPRLAGAIALALILQVLVVHVPYLNTAFGAVPLDAGGWITCAVLASCVLWVEELRKLALRRRPRGTAPASFN
jgi:Ca2+-transporting ATPase